MGIKWHNKPERFAKRLRALTEDFSGEMKIAGEVAGDEIVKSTLSGIGEGDVAFTPYSKGYQALLDAVGGKPSGAVDLRGVFLHEGKKEKTPAQVSRNLLRLGGGRKAHIFVRIAGKVIRVTTRQTRARKPTLDPQSELSTDLMHVEADRKSAKVFYKYRVKGYMLIHQRGEGRMPMRKWFSLKKRSVRAAVFGTLKVLWAARCAEFNSGD
jgi:hypothetical protein